MSRRNSWTKAYEEVEFDIPVPERQAMLEIQTQGPPKPFPASPLNPTSTPATPIASPFARPGSRTSAYFPRLASEETRAFGTVPPSASGSTSGGASTRGSMILYRRADPNEDSGMLQPPPSFSNLNRNSVYSSASGESMFSLASDSKYPITGERGLIAYAWDPELEELEPNTEEDALHDPTQKSGSTNSPWRGMLNLGVLIFLVMALLSLFVVYPAVMAVSDDGRERRITMNPRINSTGQAVALAGFDRRHQMPVDSYHLVFSDEFKNTNPSNWLSVADFFVRDGRATFASLEYRSICITSGRSPHLVVKGKLAEKTWDLPSSIGQSDLSSTPYTLFLTLTAGIDVEFVRIFHYSSPSAEACTPESAVAFQVVDLNS